jgi:hypothetical protein
MDSSMVKASFSNAVPLRREMPDMTFNKTTHILDFIKKEKQSTFCD